MSEKRQKKSRGCASFTALRGGREGGSAGAMGNPRWLAVAARRGRPNRSPAAYSRAFNQFIVEQSLATRQFCPHCQRSTILHGLVVPAFCRCGSPVTLTPA